MNVALTNVALAVHILIAVKIVRSLDIGVGAGGSLPMVIFIVCPISLKGVVVADLVLTNVALAVLVSINVISKAILDLTVFTGGRMPMACSIGIPLLTKGMLAFLLAGCKGAYRYQKKGEEK
jgi:hypothetical protein